MCHGINLSMHFQRSLVKTGMSILERKIVKTLDTFRFALLTDGRTSSVTTNKIKNSLSGGSGEFAIFGRSIPHLERLARFIADAYRSYEKKDLPLVVAAMNEETNAYLIIGLSGSSRGGNIRKKYEFKK